MKNIILLFGFILTSFNFSYAQTKEKISIYNETADAKTDIENAVKKANLLNKHVLVEIGGNWCPWCIAFDKLTKNNEDISKILQDNYEVVYLNYSPKNKNEEILKQLKHPERFGFPVFVILDNKGNLIHTQNSAYLESKDGSTAHDPKEVASFLQSWSYKALDPNTYKKQ